MEYKSIIDNLKITFQNIRISEYYGDETYIEAEPGDFKHICIWLHNHIGSPVMSLFAADERVSSGSFALYCIFEGARYKKWFTVKTLISGADASFDSLSPEMYSALCFEREIKEMFGINPAGCPDTRRLNLHCEVWPEGFYPLRKDFKMPVDSGEKSDYIFNKITGEGIFEVPVGPVHAGVIGPGHFRFSAAGEPVVNLEIRLGFTHRGIEKLLEGKTADQAVEIAERVSGDSSFGHSLAFCLAYEKLSGIKVPERAAYLRAVFLELERMYNHAAGVGGIAVDVGFGFPNALALIIKERILQLNDKLSGSRYLKNLNTPGGLKKDFSADDIGLIVSETTEILEEFKDLKNILYSNGVFMDRVEGTGILTKKAAEDLGVTGLAARASGIARDLRKDFLSVFEHVDFSIVKEDSGDALARLNVRIREFEQSCLLINKLTAKLSSAAGTVFNKNVVNKEGFALGYAEAWRGPVLYWLMTDASGAIERCKITDPSFKNWHGLAVAVPGNIIPDFPLCNKSFDLSYSGNDL